jgi:hypothetical protein
MRPVLVGLLLVAACSRPAPNQPATQTAPAPAVQSGFPANGAGLRARLGSAAAELPGTNLTLRFEDMPGNERLKMYLHELISARAPDGIYHWSWRDDTCTSELNALIIRQGRVTWYRLTNGNERHAHEWLVHEVLRSEIVDTGSPQFRSTALRMHLSNGTTQDIHYCVSVGA